MALGHRRHAVLLAALGICCFLLPATAELKQSVITRWVYNSQNVRRSIGAVSVRFGKGWVKQRPACLRPSVNYGHGRAMRTNYWGFLRFVCHTGARPSSRQVARALALTNQITSRLYAQVSFAQYDAYKTSLEQAANKRGPVPDPDLAAGEPACSICGTWGARGPYSPTLVLPLNSSAREYVLNAILCTLRLAPA